MISAFKKKFSSPNEGQSPSAPSDNNRSGSNTPTIAVSGTGGGHPHRLPPNTSSHRAGVMKLALHNHSPRGGGSGNIPAGVSVVPSELQKRFAHGVNYNMKIVIRGDRNSGKTSLWRRLQGLPHFNDYTPTPEIQVANITWSYRTFDHIVKLDIWDVVDEGKRRRPPSQTLKLDNAGDCVGAGKGCSGGSKKGGSPCSTSPVPPPSIDQALEHFACDASVVDVYKNCCGVLLVFDVGKVWTWGYVQRELLRVPSHMPVLVIANKIDLPEEERQVRVEECRQYLAEFERTSPVGSKQMAPIRFTQASMKTAAGLKFLYNYFNVPFLHLQRNCLIEALASNTRELALADQELDLLDEGNALHPQVNGADDEEDFDEEDEGGDFGDAQDEIGPIEAEEKEPIRPTISGASSNDGGRRLLEKKLSVPVVVTTNHLESSSDDEDSGGRANKMVDTFEEDLESLDGEQEQHGMKMANNGHHALAATPKPIAKSSKPIPAMSHGAAESPESSIPNRGKAKKSAGRTGGEGKNSANKPASSSSRRLVDNLLVEDSELMMAGGGVGKLDYHSGDVGEIAGTVEAVGLEADQYDPL